jgi:membrane protein implicated in regulation of membrane protease activity
MSPAVDALRERLGPPSGDEGGVLPVPAPLDALFPDGGLRRGSVVAVEGSVWLALALAAAASAAGSWCAVVGMPTLGPAAAAEVGIELSRLVLVPSPGTQWATTVAALLDGFDVVLARPAREVRPAEARRLAVRARERRAAIVAVGDWPEAVDLRLRVTGTEWTGLSSGYGRIAARHCRVASLGRGAAARERRVVTSLPDLGPVPLEPHSRRAVAAVV